MKPPSCPTGRPLRGGSGHGGWASELLAGSVGLLCKTTMQSPWAAWDLAPLPGIRSH